MSIIVYEGNEKFAYCQGQSRIFFTQISQERSSELYAGCVVEGKKGEAPSFHDAPKHQRLTVMDVVTGWEGITDRHKNPLEFNKEYLGKLLSGNASLRYTLYSRIHDPDAADVACLDDGEKPVKLDDAEKKD